MLHMPGKSKKKKNLLFIQSWTGTTHSLFWNFNQLFNGYYPSKHGIILTWSFSKSIKTSRRWTCESLGFDQTRIPPDKTVSTNRIYNSFTNRRTFFFFFFPYKLSWNKTLIPGPSNSSNLESAATLERRRETLIKKAKEYHKELESLLVSSVRPFSILSPLSILSFLFFISTQRSKNLYKYLQHSASFLNRKKRIKSEKEN